MKLAGRYFSSLCAWFYFTTADWRARLR